MRRNTKHVTTNAARTTAGLGALLTLALGTAGTATTANAAVLKVDLGALHLSTTTDTLPGEQAAHFQIIAGEPVRRVYTLRNNGLLALRNVTVSDPDVSGGSMSCGSDGAPTIATLAPHSSSSCSAAFTAVPGEHHADITASGTVFLLDIIRLSDRDKADYTAVVPALQASLSLGGEPPGASLPAGTPISAAVTVQNSGSVPLTQIAPIPPLPLANVDCAASTDTLSPGDSSACTGTFTPEPGPHVSSLTMAGNWLWKWPLTAQGPQPRQTLRVLAVANFAYTGVPVSSPPPPPSTPAVPPSTAAPTPTPALPSSSAPASARPGPIAVIPRQSPTPTPFPTLAPAPAPSAAVLQSISQFKASRGLSLPLKVLVIVIIPAVAAAAGARRVAASRR